MKEILQADSGQLKRLFVASRLPDSLFPLRELASNLWWSWHREAMDLFSSLLPDSWEQSGNNPLVILDQLDSEKTAALASDQDFLSRLSRIHREFRQYMERPALADSPTVVYFSMEYGLHISVRLYSGGLGVLAGDYLKEASDQGARLQAVGLLYRYGYFQQQISLQGDQISEYPPQEYTKMPMEPVRDYRGDWVKISVNLPGRAVWAKIWRLRVGRTDLYLLDADIAENASADRTLTHKLYGGDSEHRLKQEILLGIGGIRAMEAIGIFGDVYHCNEGHAAFMTLERIRMGREKGLSYAEAREQVRATSLFTTHTPVPAGHDYFGEDLLYTYFQDYIPNLGISWREFMALGRANREEPAERFCMSHLAIRQCAAVNGVSRLHGEVSRAMFQDLYPGYSEKEVPIGHVTNGVHYPTWIASECHTLFREYLGDHFMEDLSDNSRWAGVRQIPDQRLRETRLVLKQRLLDAVKKQLREDLTRRGEKPAAIFETLNAIQPRALVLGFARRFATYKRAQLLFSNRTRLAEIVQQASRPVLFLFAGKAHPADQPGQQLIRDIIQASRTPELQGKVIFLEGYSMELAKLLVQGVDIWLNTPTRPMEASGTSGMKAALNGVVNFSVLDGWWAEAHRPDAGWALPLTNTYPDQALQDELDAETLYNLLEMEILPAYFAGRPEGLSDTWLKYVRQTIAEIGPAFTTKRMMDDYYRQYYHPLAAQGRLLANADYLTSLSAWKTRVADSWGEIRATRKHIMDTDNQALPLGERLEVGLELYRNGLTPEDVGIEFLLFKRLGEHQLELKQTQVLELVHSEGEYSLFQGNVLPPQPGVFEYGFRLYARHPRIAGGRCFETVKWL